MAVEITHERSTSKSLIDQNDCSSSSPLQTQIPICNLTSNSELGRPSRSICSTSGVLNSRCGILDQSNYADILPSIFVSRRDGEAKRWIRLMPASAAASVTRSTQLLVLTPNWSYFRSIRYSGPVDPAFGILFARRTWGNIRPADLQPAVVHHLPQIPQGVGVIVPKSLMHTLLVPQFLQPKVTVVAIFHAVLRTFQNDRTVSTRILLNEKINDSVLL